MEPSVPPAAAPPRRPSAASSHVDAELLARRPLNGLDKAATNNRRRDGKDGNGNNGDKARNDLALGGKLCQRVLPREHEERGEEGRGDGLEKVAECGVVHLGQVEERCKGHPKHKGVERLWGGGGAL